MSTKVLMVLGGVGLGNATRAHAILSELQKLGIRADVACSGPAYRYFQHVDTGAEELLELASVTYQSKGAGLDILALPKTALRFFKAGFKSFFRLRQQLARTRYQAVIVDSNYNLATRFTGRPLISINNSDRIFAHRDLLQGAGWATYAHFWLVEALDCLYQNLIPDLVLSPWPLKERRYDNVQGVGLIVRDCVVQASERKGSVLMMGSGSGFGQMDAQALSTFDVNKFGLPNLNYDPLPALKRAEVAVINAGFSSLSEALTYRKRILAVPLANHAEQHIVCAYLQNQGWIQILGRQDLKQAVIRVQRGPHTLARATLSSNGASECAQAIARVCDPMPRAVARPYRDDATSRLAPLTPDRPQALDAQ
jgi:hypothetical protein